MKDGKEATTLPKKEINRAVLWSEGPPPRVNLGGSKIGGLSKSKDKWRNLRISSEFGF